MVATPAGTHGQLARDALDAGMHVYCEKPIAPTADEGYALARHAHEAQRTLQVGFQFRFHKGYAAAREAVADLGELARVNLTATNWFRAQAYFDASPWRATWAMAGGGVLMNQAIHQVDAMIATAGMPSHVQAASAARDTAPRSRTTRSRCSSGHRRDRSARRVARGSRRLRTLRALRRPRRGRARGRLRPPRHRARRRAAAVRRVCRRVSGAHERVGADRRRARGERVARLPRRAHRDFAGAVLDGRPPLVDGEEGTRSVELANAIYLSSLEDRASSCRSNAVSTHRCTRSSSPAA